MVGPWLLPAKHTGRRSTASLAANVILDFYTKAIVVHTYFRTSITACASGESETLIVLLRVVPDLTLYIKDAGIFVINDLKLPGMLHLISCKLKSGKA